MDPHARTPLEQAHRQVIEGEAQVMAQIIRIGELISMRKDTTEAEAVLADLEDKLRSLYETLEQEQAASGTPPDVAAATASWSAAWRRHVADDRKKKPRVLRTRGLKNAHTAEKTQRP
jgi:plasmid stabilization system protein ParE